MRITWHFFSVSYVLCLCLLFAACASVESLERQGGGRTYHQPYAVTYRSAVEALEDLGFIVKSDDRERGEIRAQFGQYRKGFLSLCYGNVIGVFLTPVGENETKVEVQEKYVYSIQTNLDCDEKAPLVFSKLGAKLSSGVFLASASATPSESLPIVVDEVFDNRIKDLARQLSLGLQNNRVTRLAVLPFEDASHGLNKPLGNYLTDKLTMELFKTGLAKIVERSRLTKVFDELKLGTSPTFDDTTVKSVGRLLGVDAVVLGAFAQLSSQKVDVNSRLVNVETAEILAMGSVQVPTASFRKLSP